jgi:hypothetical protein
VNAEVSNGDELLLAETRDLSVSGVAVVTDDALREGKTVWLTLLLTQDGIEDPHDDPFETSATVRWGRVLPDGRCIAGLAFGPTTAAQKAQLERFLAKTSE